MSDGPEISLPLDVNAIMGLIPHRYPLLLVDQITEIDLGETITGIKNVTINEPFFQGHFPGHPIMPGVLIIEALAQTAGCLAMLSLGEEAQGSLVYFMAIDGAKFRRPVVPGDQLALKVTKQRGKGKVWRFRGEAFVGDDLACEGDFTAMVAPQNA